MSDRMLELKYNRIFCSIFYLFTFSGFSWQVYEVSSGYFQFHVMTRISFNLSVGNEMKAINLRFLYYEAFDRERYEKDTGEKIGNHSESLDMYYAVQKFTNDVTIDQIMKYTPSVDDLVDMCDLITVIDCDPKKHISVQKYVSNVFIIYRFIFYNPSEKGYDETAFYTPNNYGILSYAMLKPEYFKHNFVIGFFLNSVNEIPYFENSIAVDSDTDYNFATKQQHVLSFSLRPHSIIIYKLPAPYKTKCRKKYKMYDCFSECVNEKTIRKFFSISTIEIL